MAKILTVKEILDMDDGDIIKGVSGKLVNLYKEMSGSNSNGEWTLRNGKIKDSTGEIDVVFSNVSVADSARNQDIEIFATKSEQHGWVGMKLQHRKFTKKGESKPTTAIELKVTSAAQINYGGISGGNSSSNGNSKQSQKNLSSNDNKMPQQQFKIDVLGRTKDLVSYHHLCAQFVHEAYENEDINKGLTPTDLKDITTTVFIQGCKEGLHLLHFGDRATPIVPEKKSWEPKEWAEALIPGGDNKGKKISELKHEDILKYHTAFVKDDAKHWFAKCIAQAVLDLDIQPEPPEDPPAKQLPEDDLGEDDIPF